MPFPSNLDLSTLNGANGFRLSGMAADDLSGYSVASAGDVNGDGFADLIVGALGADPHGSYSGASCGCSARPRASAPTSIFPPSTASTASSSAAWRPTIEAAVSAGHVNGDGIADLFVGALLADPHGYRSGASYVVFGKAKGFSANLDLAALDGKNGFKLSGG